MTLLVAVLARLDDVLVALPSPSAQLRELISGMSLQPGACSSGGIGDLGRHRRIGTMRAISLPSLSRKTKLRVSTVVGHGAVAIVVTTRGHLAVLVADDDADVLLLLAVAVGRRSCDGRDRRAPAAGGRRAAAAAVAGSAGSSMLARSTPTALSTLVRTRLGGLRARRGQPQPAQHQRGDRAAAGQQRGGVDVFSCLVSILNLPLSSLMVCRWQAADTAPPCADLTIARP